MTEFQFPSNGKVERKGATPSTQPVGAVLFQFPSNGKVERKLQDGRNRCLDRNVSIPFKRESRAQVMDGVSVKRRLLR